MKYQNLFSGKNEKKRQQKQSGNNFSSAELAKRVVKVKLSLFV